ncbi:unnamed protein product [Colias eurytheme]|nr:unnamed protein product [Colias eurytheme]
MASNYLVNVPKLKGRENYSEWVFAAENFLVLEDMVHCIRPISGKMIEAAEDAKTKAKLIMTIDSALSEKHMHDVFVEWCRRREHSSQAANRPTFLRVLKQEKIAIHHPRKDQCDTCCSFNNNSQKEYDDHIIKKKEEKVVVITVDVQSVLLAPKLLASSLYYKLKLQYHNFTVYDWKTRKITIYFWHEADGGVSASVIAPPRGPSLVAAVGLSSLGCKPAP